MNSKLMKKMTGLLATAALLVACGGNTQPEPVTPISPYIGKWGTCDGKGRMDWLQIRPGAAQEQMLLEVETTFHTKTDCSGSPGAYLTHSQSSIVAEKTGQVIATIMLSDIARTLQAGAFNTTTKAGTLRVLSSGMTVDYSRLNNAPGIWCVRGVGGSEYCFQEDDETLIEGDDQMAFYRENDLLYAFVRDDKDGTYKRPEVFQRY
ncbi:hypothetical protein [Limnohabitans sp.]|uniref:hypothetical protein n=1 Tax=Limnohabitans sp. TaxID=1907725 RepID=UPI002AFEB127|nr:hypothetical protein [Limnohabitans sp.]